MVMHWESNLIKFSWRKNRKKLVAKFGKLPEPVHTSDTVAWKWQWQVSDLEWKNMQEDNWLVCYLLSLIFFFIFMERIQL